MTRPEQRIDAIGSIAALDEPARAKLFAYVRAAPRAVTREEAADAVGISRKLAAFHLERLVMAGLLEAGVDEGRPRTVGRAPKTYRAAVRALQVSIPPRSYLQLATILVDAATAEAAGEPAVQARRRVARETGRRVAGESREHSTARGGRTASLAAVEAVLAAEGFEPYRPGAGRLRLRNCPFHPLAEREPELVCDINHAYLCGLLEGLRATTLEAELAPAPGECCVEIARADRARTRP